MSTEKSPELTISLGRFPELHADIEAGLLKDGQPRLEHRDEPHPAPHPRHAGFRKFVRRMLVRVLSVFVAILVLHFVMNVAFGMARKLRHHHHHDYDEARPHHWHDHHHGHHDHHHSPHRPHYPPPPHDGPAPPHHAPHFPPHHPPHHPPPPHDGPQPPCDDPAPPSHYSGYYGYTPYRPEHGYGYRRPYPEYSAYRPGPGYNYNTPYHRPGFAYGYAIMDSAFRATPGAHRQASPTTRPHRMNPTIGATTITNTIDAPSKDRGHTAHTKPLHKGANVHRLAQELKHVDRESLSALIQGSLPLSKLGALFRTPGDTCVPSIPVDGIEVFTFDPTETSSIIQTVAGAIGSDISIVPTTDSKASFTARVMASSQDIADKITLKMNTDNEGHISFVLNGPKLISRDECAYAIIELRIPETVANLDALRTNYVYGKYELDRRIARNVAFGDFSVATAVGPVMTPPINANKVTISVVSGNIHGFYRVLSGVSINTVRGDIDAGVNVSEAKKSSVNTASVSGSVSVRVSGDFDGKFSATTVNGKTIVEDASNGSSRLHFDNDKARVKTGTFGPEKDVNPGSSSLNAATMNGNVSIEFD
ncbi:hypothetical protein LPJ81_005575 [Coemansia sp. IMI 209127]|nr:hypothetical protein LPJ81_005575 [Coemansia sp. IMI 209127]